LLPTPAVNDMGAGKDPQACGTSGQRSQKAADGRPAPHGKSLEQEALRLGAHYAASHTNAGQFTSSDDSAPVPN
jgi:hypothetical protein